MTKFNTLLSSLASAWLILGLASPGLAQSPCVNGSANYNGTNYPCSNVDLLSAMGVNQVGSGEMNDIWGWTDPLDGKEYVILGRTNGTAFIDISDPLNPVYLANVNTETSSSLWRDIKVYNNHAFIVSEAGGHGMQVFDLTRLRNITNPPVTLLRDAWYSGFGNAHNIVINEESGRAYGVGTNTASGGLHIMDISNPLNPTLLGFFSEDGYTHDAQVVNYIGPDGQYAGKEIAFACNENTVTIVDVTDPSD
ncbi:MAG: choice-of-anchor B family protein, partial [Flavobacteriales bacterium]